MLKKIISEQERERKARRSKIVIGTLMVFLIVFSSLGYALLSRDSSGDSGVEKVTYKGVKFIKNSGFWTTSLNGQALYFNYLPYELNDTLIEGDYKLEDYYNKVIYIVNYNPSSAQTISLLGGIASRVQEACLSGTNCSNNELPIKTCEDYVIYFKENSETNKVYRDRNCVYLEGDFFKTSDKLNYEFLSLN